MGRNSKIEWTDDTRNLWWGCSEVHQGCDNCYAREWAARFGTEWGNDVARKAIKSVWSKLASDQAFAKANNEIRRVFVGSMMDIFEKPMTLVDDKGNRMGNTGQLRIKFFEEIVPFCPNLMFLLLTKRPSNIYKYLPIAWTHEQPQNVMYGASVVNEQTALDVKRHFDKFHGKKFYSVEPQLEFIDFSKNGLLEGIDWLIQGGESGPNKRPFETAWARHTKEVCAFYNVPYFFKQVDKVKPIPEDLMIRQFPSYHTLKTVTNEK